MSVILTIPFKTQSHQLGLCEEIPPLTSSEWLMLLLQRLLSLQLSDKIPSALKLIAFVLFPFLTSVMLYFLGDMHALGTLLFLLSRQCLVTGKELLT